MAKKASTVQAVNDRFSALVQTLLNQGLLAPDASNTTAPLTQIDYDTTLTPPVRLFFRDTATQAQKDLVNTIVNGWTWKSRRARLLTDIRNDINALTATQKTNIRNDLLAGTPSKAQGDRGPGGDALLVLWTLQQVGGLSAADKVIVGVSAAALYARDNPTYLVNPTFDPTINVSGDEIDPNPPA